MLSLMEQEEHERPCSNEMYDVFLRRMQEYYQATAREQLYTTTASGLFDVFLSQFPAGDVRQHYTCHACRKFVEKYGGLVSITDDNCIEAVMWPYGAPDPLYDSVMACKSIVERSKVTGVFVDDGDAHGKTWGQPTAGGWKHMHIVPIPMLCRSSVLKTASQVMAENRQDYIMLNQSLAKYTIQHAKDAVALLESAVMYRYEKCLEIAKWFLRIHNEADRIYGEPRNRYLWREVAYAPAGFCHVGSTMIGTLLDDISSGCSTNAIMAHFLDKMNPLQYQRPSAAPARATIQQAEDVVKKLGVENSLKRRYATMDDVQTIWTPTPVAKESSQHEGVFSHLRAKEDISERRIEQLPPKTMTWVKFRDKVLPTAAYIEYYAGPAMRPYFALTTAEDMDAPPIIQWDSLENRNPVSWYVHVTGSYPATWNLVAGHWAIVDGICLQPSMWAGGGKFAHMGESVMFILRGAYDTGGGSGLALFPEILKADLHHIRSVIEAYSKHGKLGGGGSVDAACGIRLQKDRGWNYKFRVTTVDGYQTMYTLDRWD